MRQVPVFFALCLGGALMIGLLLLMPHIAQSAPPVVSAASPTGPSSPQDELFYRRIQTVTLHAPESFYIYTTTFTTTIQIYIEEYALGGYIRLPTDAITREAYCAEHPDCQVIWGEISGSPVVTYAGVGTATIYLEYDTWSKAWRDPASPIVNLSYPVGPFDPEKEFSITNTIVFSRAYDPMWEPAFVTPTGYVYDAWNYTLRWQLSRTSRLEFTANFTEPLLGADLVIERLETSSAQPYYGEPVRYTVTVRNVGSYRTGRAVLCELFVRPSELGPPTVLTDHVGGWAWFDEEISTMVGYHWDALFKWYSGSVATDWWYHGLGPGEALTGTTVLTWPGFFDEGGCGVWAKVDPTYLQVGMGYDWWGYNSEGLECGLDEHYLPTCKEESNNVRAMIYLIYLPLVLRDSMGQ